MSTEYIWCDFTGCKRRNAVRKSVQLIGRISDQALKGGRIQASSVLCIKWVVLVSFAPAKEDFVLVIIFLSFA